MSLSISQHINSVTAVGGVTQVPEIAVDRFGSGGGFSNYVRVIFESPSASH